jgi:amphi-Trp domain-containing protein
MPLAEARKYHAYARECLKLSEEAAKRLHAIADELASGNGLIIERDGLTVTVAVPDEIEMKVEVEIESDEREIEIELTW